MDSLTLTYIEYYYGIYRDIIFDPIDHTVFIYFNAYLNDELNFKYTKKYKTREEALAEVEKYISSDRNYKAKISYSEESIKKINHYINEFLKAIVKNEVPLPSRDYHFNGKISDIKTLIEEVNNYVQWDEI